METDDYEHWVQSQINSGDKPAIRLPTIPEDQPESFTVYWYWRALRVLDGLDAGDRFIALWIAFNSILVQKYEQSLRTKRKRKGPRREPWISEADLLKEFRKDGYWSEILNEIHDSEFSVFLAQLGSLCPVTKGKTGEKVSITDGAIADIFDVIYAVRNNLFHGGKDPSNVNSRDYKLVKYSYSILLSFVTRHLLKERFLVSERPYLIGEILDGYDILT